MSLYRKYRPQKFMDVVGQDHVTTTLINALKSGKFSHAYLFAGPKGSGKTTTARLLAKALNCTGRPLNQANFEPCDKCMSCKEVTSGHSLDVVEIDAASNRGIDEIRELRDKIRFAPTAGKFKIYVIDECHMLTKEAFNALLKTLEEPPAHAIFVLATTELHKVPPTILSRVQVFDFQKAKIEEITQVLKKIVKAEKLIIEDEALQLIARLAYGAFRDAVTMLDQVANLRANAKITLAQVQAVLGQSTEKSVWELVEALGARDRALALKIVNNIYFEGKNLENFIAQMIEILRKTMLAQAGLAISFEMTKEEGLKIQKLAEQFTSEELISLIEKLTETMPKVKTSILGQLPLEMVVFQLTEIQVQNANLKMQNDNVKLKVEEEITPIPEPIIQRPEPPAVKEKIIEKEILITNNSIGLPAAEISDEIITNNLSSVWPDIIKFAKTHNNGLAAMLKDANINNISDDKVTLGVKFKFHADQICAQKNRKIIEEALAKIAGKTCQVDCIVDPELKVKKPLDHDEELLNDAKDVFEV